MRKVKIGVVGCGNISNAYLTAAKKFNILEVVGCADINMDAAQAKAAEHGIKAMTVEELIADPSIEIVINLTVPKAHAEVSLKCLAAGKNVHCEKPLAVTYEEGKMVIDTAKAKKLLVGCAPDTFLGGGLQTCRKIVDDGWLGRLTSGTAVMMGRGPEPWHPNPAFFYQHGGGPMLDMGPYYVTALVHLLGPARRIVAFTGKAFDERIAGAEAIRGQKIPVEIPTHYTGVVEFANGAQINMIFSFDVYGHGHSPIEIYGTLGSMKVPDPNSFGGQVQVKVGGGEWANVGYTHIYTDNMRSIGVADMAYAIRTGRPYRCNGEMALHVLEIMTGFEKAASSGKVYALKSTCEQPAPLPMGLINGLLD